MKNIFKIIIILLVVSATAIFSIYDVNSIILNEVKSYIDTINNHYENNKITFIIGFFILFLAINSLMVPGSLMLLLLAGYLFGFKLALILTVVSGTIGSAIAFLCVRYFFYESLSKKYDKIWHKMEKSFNKNGVIYLLALRISPGIPTNSISICMGLMPISLITFIATTFVGIIPWYAIYVYSGQKIASINSLSDLISPQTTLAFLIITILIILSLWVKNKLGKSE